MNLVLYAVPFFILALAIELAWGWYRGSNSYRLADTINSLQMGTLSRLRGVLQIGIGGAVYGALTNEFTAFEMNTADPLVWVLAFVGYDFCYYWSHRMGHEWRLFWASHVAHQQLGYGRGPVAQRLCGRFGNLPALGSHFRPC